MKFNNRYRIGIDLDGTVYNFVDQFRNYVHTVTGKPLSEMPPANTWYFFSEQWGISHEEYDKLLIQGVKDKEIFWKGEMYPDALETIKYLFEDRLDEIFFVTSRGSSPEMGVPFDLARESTEYWLDSVGLPCDRLIITDNKHDINLSILIDDAPYQIQNSVLAGIETIIFDQPWNMELTFTTRGYGWKHIREILDTKYPASQDFLYNME